MQFWKDLEKNQIIVKIMKEFSKHKSETALEKMGKQTLLNYVQNKLDTSKTRVGQRSRAVRVA